MEAILAELILIPICVIVIPLAVLRAGIRHQERAASLTSQPASFAAALSRRLLGLHAIKPTAPDATTKTTS